MRETEAELTIQMRIQDARYKNIATSGVYKLPPYNICGKAIITNFAERYIYGQSVPSQCIMNVTCSWVLCRMSSIRLVISCSQVCFKGPKCYKDFYLSNRTLIKQKKSLNRQKSVQGYPFLPVRSFGQPQSPMVTTFYSGRSSDPWIHSTYRAFQPVSS